MVTEVMTWRMDQGVTMMMKVRDTAESDLTRLARVSASSESLMGLRRCLWLQELVPL